MWNCFVQLSEDCVVLSEIAPVDIKAQEGNILLLPNREHKLEITNDITSLSVVAIMTFFLLPNCSSNIYHSRLWEETNQARIQTPRKSWKVLPETSKTID